MTKDDILVFLFLLPSVVASALVPFRSSVPDYVKLGFKVELGLLMFAVGMSHFNRKLMGGYCAMIPKFLPGNPHAYVCTTGLIEIMAAVGLLVPFLSTGTAWLLIALYIAVFPANVYESMSADVRKATGRTKGFSLIRLPVQFALIAHAHWFTVGK